MSPLAAALRLLVRGYRTAVSPLLPPRCRFAPTCSQYALEALEVHGALRGTWLAVRRVARCHPFHPGGHDPVPPSRRSGGTAAPADARPVGEDGPVSDDGSSAVRAGRAPGPPGRSTAVPSTPVLGALS